MWTDDQLKAINAPVSDILVTAAAGSGKTAVMVERLIHRLTADDGVDIDKVLVVTFTNAAAAEIKERIAIKIAQKLEEGDNPRLKKQLALLSRASICTIHSFCLNILKNNFHLLDLDPNFRIGDTPELKMLMDKALDDVLDEYYECEDVDFMRVVNSFTRKSDEPLCDIILKLYNFSMSMPEPKKWFEDAIGFYMGDCESHLQSILNEVKSAASDIAKVYKKALRLCANDSAFETAMGILSDEMGYAEGIAAMCDRGWDDVYNFVKGYKFATLRSNKNMDAEIFEEIKMLRASVRDDLKQIGAEKVKESYADIQSDLAYMKPVVSKICEVAVKFGEKYEEYKKERNVVDFNDFEHYALKLLTAPDYIEVAESLRNRFDEIYIDEYQDCNGVQEAIFKAVSREIYGKPNMFMVGDMKQCIYNFRNADPTLFKYKSENYAPYGHGGDYNKIVLSCNFRSRAQVLTNANAVFSRLMNDKLGGLNYTQDEYLYEGAEYEDVNHYAKFTDIRIIDGGADAGENDLEDKPANVEAEAEMVAREIRSMVLKGDFIIYDKSADEYRPVRYRDIVILMRNANSSAEFFADALSKYSIPSFADVGEGYFQCEEVAAIIDLVKIIINPMNDISLVATMRSVLYNFADSELLKIRNIDRNGCFYNALMKYAGEEKDALSSKATAFLSQLESYRFKSSVMKVDEFLSQVVYETGYMDYISTLPGGNIKKANLQMLINEAARYCANGGEFIGFADHMEKVTSSGGGTSAKLIGEKDDVVRIMTIHKSKGLEFPVVFFSQCGKRFNVKDTSAPVIYHREMGIGINYVDEQKRFTYVPTFKKAVSNKILEDSLSEEIRLMYVAFTRAREKLIITGVVNNYDKIRSDILSCIGDGNHISTHVALGIRNYLQWLLCALLPYDRAGVIATPDGGSFRLDVTSVYEYANEGVLEEGEKKAIPAATSYSEYKGEILRRLEYEYPYANLSALPRNVTVTELKRLHETETDDTYRIYRMPQLKQPSFMGGNSEPSAAQVGTLMHLCMEKIKLTEEHNSGTIKEEIDALVAEGIISADLVPYINADAIAGFFKSQIGKEMTSAKSVYREVPFEILVSADEIFQNSGTDEKIVVQGMIDAYFIDDQGNVILVDYKTDRCRMGTEEFKEHIRSKYALQLHYYDKALRLITGKRVHKKYIYLFDIGEYVEI